MNKQTLSALVFSSFLLMVNPAHAVFIGASGGDLHDLDVATNTSTNLGNSGVGSMFDIALSPTSNILYGVTGAGDFYSISQTNGAASFIGATMATDTINGLTFDSSGTLFGSGGTNLFTVNLGSGLATTVGGTGFTPFRLVTHALAMALAEPPAATVLSATVPFLVGFPAGFSSSHPQPIPVDVPTMQYLFPGPVTAAPHAAMMAEMALAVPVPSAAVSVKMPPVVVA